MLLIEQHQVSRGVAAAERRCRRGEEGLGWTG
jgi:hypothetical protein